MFLSQGKRPVARKPLTAISPFAARLYEYVLPIAELFTSLVDGDDSPALGLNGATIQLLGSRIF